MRKTFFFTVSICLFCLSVFAQNRQTAVKPTPKPSVKTNAASEIAPAEWQRLADALRAEKWDAASALALESLQKLKTENVKKQLAQLNYIYLYALAGKTAEGKMPFEELEKTAQNFVGKEFLMVSRQILENCATKVNYICPQPGSQRILRVTATNQTGSAIHFFEYTKLAEPFAFAANAEKIGFVGGTLEKVETAAVKNAKYLRLIFNEGYVQIATD